MRFSPQPAETLLEIFLFLAAAAIVAVTVLIFGFMGVLALPLFNKALLIQMITQPWLPDKGIYGIAPMMAGTLLISLPAVVMAFPLSVGAAALMSVISPFGFGRWLKKGVHLMTGIPTVIYGFIGVFLLVPIIRSMTYAGSGFCILSASLLLSILISPTLILFFSESFERVPRSYLEAVDALGANRAQKFLFVILPNAWRGVVGGILLGLGRAVGDTLIALMVAGNAIGAPESVFDSARTLTAHIALIIAADFDSTEFRVIFAASMLLYLFTLLLTLLARILSGELEKRV
jgi:phosphate transport system permease protein